MTEIIHRARGWHATMNPRKITLKYRLPGDDPALVRALHVLVQAQLLPGNAVAPGELPCPRCGRPTATARVRDDRGDFQLVAPSVCTGCRVEWISAHVDWGNVINLLDADTAAADAEAGDKLARFLARVRAAKRAGKF